MSSTASQRTAAAVAARRAYTEAALHRVQQALTALRRDKARITVAAVARRAAVSRTFIYDNPHARTAVATALAGAGEQRRQIQAVHDDEQNAPWRERALNAEHALNAAHGEIVSQRKRIGDLLGQLRDLQQEWTEESITRITGENTTLKQRIRQLTADNRTLEERLAAARSNLRFQDRRIAGLEARIADPAPNT